MKIQLGAVFIALCLNYLSASFFENQNISVGQNILATFDIDSSYQLDSKLFSLHHDFITGARWEHFVDKFENGYVYIPMLRQMLNEAEIPQEFLYLAMVESGFSPRAYSPKKASGLWQIVPKTGRQLGLIINEFIDERRDPIKSTQAAIKYLKFLHGITGKWYLTAMAYNCGIGRLNRGIKEAGSDDIFVLMDDKKDYIPKETKNYIRMIVSMNVAFNDIDALKTQEREYFLNRGATITLASVKVPAGTSLDSIARGANISKDELKSYNRQFKYDFLPPVKGEYDVYLPYENLLTFKQEFIPKPIDLNNYFVVHKVKKGDTLYGLSRAYGISVDALKDANNLSKSLLSINQKLIIPLTQSKYKLAQTTIK